jgi:hypothetical protein
MIVFVTIVKCLNTSAVKHKIYMNYSCKMHVYVKIARLYCHTFSRRL